MKLWHILLLALVGAAAINWRGALAFTVLIILYDKLFDAEDKEMAAIDAYYKAEAERIIKQAEKDARFKKIMEDDWGNEK